MTRTSRLADRQRTRRRLSRTFSTSRWGEYDSLLKAARLCGYQIISLEEWLDRQQDQRDLLLVMRHDVDQHPRSSLPMLDLDEKYGAVATWYFRWRTAHPKIISTVQKRGASVGLHYETLTRIILTRGLSPDAVTPPLVEEARRMLRHEIALFMERLGPIRSVCPHGDTRVPGVRNGSLMHGVDHRDFGIEFDGNEAILTQHLGIWLTDRTKAEGSWKEDLDPFRLLAERCSPILCVTHPNNWVSGFSLWADRILSAALPPPDRTLPRPARTGRDRPPGL